MQIAIVTDSTADIPANLAAHYAIRVIPAILVINGQSIQDGVDISRQAFYQQLPAFHSHPTTATPSPEQFTQIYKGLFQQGAQSILSIHIASELSGIFSTASLAAQAFGGKVRVIDSRSLSMGIGYQVLAAAQAAINYNTLENIIERLHNIRQRIRVIAMLDTLTYIHRSGRVSWTKARIGSLLNIKPFIEIKDGEVINLSNARTRQRGIAQIKKFVTAWGPLEQIAILHSNAGKDAKQLHFDITSSQSVDSIIVDITPTIGVHVGPNGLGIAALLL